MAARRIYILDDSRVILRGSRHVSNIFETGPSLFQSRKRKSRDRVSYSEFEPKKSCFHNSTDWLEGETLQRPSAEGSRCLVSTIAETKPSGFRNCKRKASDAVVRAEFEPKKLCSQTSIDASGGETLENTPRIEDHTKDCRPRSPAHNLDCQPSSTKKRKCIDGGSEIEPKKCRRESTKTDSEHERALKKRQKERRILRKAMKRVATAKVSDFELKYEQIEELGEGGFGSVFAGVRISDNQPVAIKHIKREEVDFAPVIIEKEFYSVPNEVVLMTKAAPDRHAVGKSPSVSLLDWYLQDEGEEVILVMERPTPSEDLYSYWEMNGPLPEDQAKMLMRQVVDALVDLHAKGVFHRDIKMENLLVQTTESGPTIRIIDFGCGCNIQSKPYYDYSGTHKFTPPEVFTNRGYHAGPTSVWQIGALLYELVRSDYDKEFTIKRCEKGKLSVSSLSRECRDFLQACLTPDPNQRISLDQLSHHPWFSPV